MIHKLIEKTFVLVNFHMPVYCNMTDVGQINYFIPCVCKTWDPLFDFRVCNLPNTSMHGKGKGNPITGHEGPTGGVEV
jgi:hypothetical protein